MQPLVVPANLLPERGWIRLSLQVIELNLGEIPVLVPRLEKTQAEIRILVATLQVDLPPSRSNTPLSINRQAALTAGTDRAMFATRRCRWSPL
jgi:hypothetical protein